MTTKTIQWDAAAMLRDEADVVEFLNAALEEALEEGDVSILTQALGVAARARGMSQIAKDANLSRESLYKSLSPEGNPSFSTVARVLKAMGANLKIERENEPA